MNRSKPKAIVIGASGGIGYATVAALGATKQFHVISVSRSYHNDLSDSHFSCDYTESSIRDIAEQIGALDGAIGRLIICNGVLHGDDFQPERALKRLDAAAMDRVFHANTITPTLWLSAFMDVLKQAPEPRIAVFSARVGSISDNQLGGWYSYRASKAALNMVLKCAAIELARLNPQAKLVAFHPGTTNTNMSKPFQKGVPAEKLFSPDFVAARLLGTLDSIVPDGELAFLDWDGKPIAW
jgi:NAD(P)-dependent dehydrogenase (short-subunit alcohol dehydrogenase family)